MGKWNKTYTVWVRKPNTHKEVCEPIGTVEGRGFDEGMKKAENLCKVTGYKLRKIVEVPKA